MVDDLLLLVAKLWGFTEWESFAAQQTCHLPLSFSNFNFVFLPIDWGTARAFGLVDKSLSNVIIKDNLNGFKVIVWLDIGI